MAKSKDDTNLSKEEMRWWLGEEVRRVMKAADLQVRDATDFVTAYIAGRLSADEASARMYRYGSRWGESNLMTAMSKPNMSDDEILNRLDEEVGLAPQSLGELPPSQGKWSGRRPTGPRGKRGM
jgi:hypothetical protein